MYCRARVNLRGWLFLCRRRLCWLIRERSWFRYGWRSCPDQHDSFFVNSELLRLDQFRLQVFQVRIIQVKLPLQCPIGDPLVLLEPVDDVCEDILKCHDCPSVNVSSKALASCKSAVSNPSVNQW